MTLGIDLVASHLAGDYLLQSQRMAASKLTDGRVRALHVSVYALAHLPVALAHGRSWRRRGAFLALLWAAHYATDSHRWRTSNPWPPMPILHDQSLHAVQSALLARLL